jgi:DNA-binding response OmpR family regulator
MHAMSHRIAVFNHSPHILLLIESILKPKGFEVFTFVETLTDISKVVELTPDLVIIGHVKGFIDDEYEIIHEFRNNPETEAIPIIICTTGAAQIQQSGKIAGVTHLSIVPKPFNVRELVDAVHHALGVQTNSVSVNTDHSAQSGATTIL